MKTHTKQPNNRAIALLVVLNLIATMFILIQINKSEFDSVAYANSLEEVEPNRKAGEEIAFEETEEEEILFSIKQVTDHSIETGTIPLYFSHSNEHGTYFTYLRTEQPNTWTQGYWYIDYGTLELANINPTMLNHNDEIQGVFYANADDGDHFEIKEVIALSNEHTR